MTAFDWLASLLPPVAEGDVVRISDRILGDARVGHWNRARELAGTAGPKYAQAAALLEVMTDLYSERDATFDFLAREGIEESPVYDLIDLLDKGDLAVLPIVADAIEAQEGALAMLRRDRRVHLPGVARRWRTLAARLDALRVAAV